MEGSPPHAQTPCILPCPQCTLGRHRLDWGGIGSQRSTMRSLRSELRLWVGVQGYSPGVPMASAESFGPVLL